MKTISKSKYLAYKSCPKSLWLLVNHPELAKEDPSAAQHIEDGKTVGRVAKSYFPNTVDTTTYKDNGDLDVSTMIALTNKYLLEDKENIAEASFSIDNLFCSIDLLHKTEDGYEIYEVKATTGIEKEHYPDAAFQRYVLEKRGLKVKGIYLLHLNNEYRRHGELELEKLFIADFLDGDPKYQKAYSEVRNDIDNIKALLTHKDEIDYDFNSNCKECPFHDYCYRHLPTPNVSLINGLRNTYKYLNEGIVTYPDVLQAEIKLNYRQKVQIESYLKKEDRIINPDGVHAFLDTVTYPIYHLDFESIMLPIPPCDNAWPYEQIPTQYSLHIEYEDGHLEHKEFLGDSIDPRRAIAEALCRDIPSDKCVMAYNKTFECSRLNELADLFPDLSDHLRAISKNVVDLIVPFKGGDYYDHMMAHSNSIKYVLPALYPNDPELDYHALPVVHNGGEAMDIYPKMLEAEPKERERIRDGLLKYCCLDTLAMVKVLRKLKEVE